MLPIHFDEFCQSEEYFSLFSFAGAGWKWMMVLRTGMVYTGMLRMCVIKDAWMCAWYCEGKPDKEPQAKNCLPIFSAATLPSYLPFPERSFTQILPQALLSFHIALISLPCSAGRKHDTLGSGIRQSWAQILVSPLMS